MFNLNSLQPEVTDVLLKSRIKDFQRIAFHDMALRMFDGITIDAKLSTRPVVVVDSLKQEPALIVVVQFVKDYDEITYTFQVEVWPTNELQRISPPNWLPKPVTVVPKCKIKVSFLAEKNSVAYFDCSFEGQFKEVLANINKALGK